MSGTALAEPLEALVEKLLETGLVTGLAALVGTESSILGEAWGGHRDGSGSSSPTTSSLFDLASLSKPLTATLAVQLEASGELRLRTRLRDVWGAKADAALAEARLEDLLRHRAGLRPWVPLYALFDAREEAVRWLLSGTGLGAERPAYSDLGFILWAASAEKALGVSVDTLLRQYVLRPLGLGRQITPSSPAPRRAVACDLAPDKEAAMASAQGLSLRIAAPRIGQIQDGNARWWGGYAGHAGLFGSAKGLLLLAREWLEPTVLDHRVVRRALSGDGEFLLGWRKPPPSLGGGALPIRSAFGHTGFTGGSLWVDSEKRVVYVLLSHRARDEANLDPWRQRLHSLGRHVAHTGPKRRRGHSNQPEVKS